MKHISIRVSPYSIFHIQYGRGHVYLPSHTQLQWPNVNECVYGRGQVSRLNPAMMILTCMRCLTMICRLDKEMEMKQNEAYGPVSSSQPRAPPNSTEETYELL